MKYLFVLVLSLVSTFSFSQVNRITIHTIDGDTIASNWIKLNPYPFLSQPYIRMDSVNGKRIALKEINSYQGYDQNNDFRKLKVYHSNRNIRFTEWFHEEKIDGELKLYQDCLTFGLPADFPKEEKKDYYSIGMRSFKKLNFKNVKNDLKFSRVINKEIRLTEGLIILQRASQLVGIAMLSSYLIDITPNQSSEFMKSTNKHSFFLSAGLIVLPISLNTLKRKLLIQSLQNTFINRY